MQTLSLSGWTQPKDALLGVVPDALTFDYSDYMSDQAAIAALAAYKDVPRVVAWSMGGQLALKAIAAGALAPERLVLIAPPYQFVNNASFSAGMDPLTFRQFRDNYASQPARTKDRFHALVAKGDKYLRQVMEALTHHPHVEDTVRWLPWLEGLGRDSLHGLTLPYHPKTTLIHGTMDAIVPVAQATHMQSLLPQATLEIWQEVAHAPHLHDAERVKAVI